MVTTTRRDAAAFCVTPRELCDQLGDIRPESARVLFAILALFGSGAPHLCGHLSLRLITRACGFSQRRSSERAIEELTAAGLLEVSDARSATWIEVLPGVARIPGRALRTKRGFLRLPLAVAIAVATSKLTATQIRVAAFVFQRLHAGEHRVAPAVIGDAIEVAPQHVRAALAGLAEAKVISRPKMRRGVHYATPSLDWGSDAEWPHPSGTRPHGACALAAADGVRSVAADQVHLVAAAHVRKEENLEIETQRESAPRSIAAEIVAPTGDCTKCLGTGAFPLRGRRVGDCFACSGSGKTEFLRGFERTVAALRSGVSS